MYSKVYYPVNKEADLNYWKKINSYTLDSQYLEHAKITLKPYIWRKETISIFKKMNYRIKLRVLKRYI